MLTSSKRWEMESVQIEMAFGCPATLATSRMNENVKWRAGVTRNVQALLMPFLFAAFTAQLDSDLLQDQLGRSRQEPTRLA